MSNFDCYLVLIVLLCWLVLTPQMTGTVFEAPETVKASVRH